jgi:hypothetical protein
MTKRPPLGRFEYFPFAGILNLFRDFGFRVSDLSRAPRHFPQIFFVLFAPGAL